MFLNDILIFGWENDFCSSLQVVRGLFMLIVRSRKSPRFRGKNRPSLMALKGGVFSLIGAYYHFTSLQVSITQPYYASGELIEQITVEKSIKFVPFLFTLIFTLLKKSKF